MVGRFDLARGRLVERDQEHDSDGGRVKVPQVGWEVNRKYERQVGVVKTNRKTLDKHYLYLRDGGGAHRVRGKFGEYAAVSRDVKNIRLD